MAKKTERSPISTPFPAGIKDSGAGNQNATQNKPIPIRSTPFPGFQGPAPVGPRDPANK